MQILKILITVSTFKNCPAVYIGHLATLLNTIAVSSNQAPNAQGFQCVEYPRRAQTSTRAADEKLLLRTLHISPGTHHCCLSDQTPVVGSAMGVRLERHGTTWHRSTGARWALRGRLWGESVAGMSVPAR